MIFSGHIELKIMTSIIFSLIGRGKLILVRPRPIIHYFLVSRDPGHTIAHMTTGISVAPTAEMVPTEGRSESVKECAGSGSSETFVTRVRIHPGSQLALWQQALTRRDRPIQDGWIEPGSAVGEELSLRRFPGYTREATARPPNEGVCAGGGGAAQLP